MNTAQVQPRGLLPGYRRQHVRDYGRGRVGGVERDTWISRRSNTGGQNLYSGYEVIVSGAWSFHPSIWQ
jgi:hypothetical protein